MSKYCEVKSPEIPELGGGVFFCTLPADHAGKHFAESQQAKYEDSAWIVHPDPKICPRCGAIHKLAGSVDRCILIDKVKRLERENAAQCKVIEAIREMFAFGPEWRMEPIKKALAELDAGEGR